MVHEKYIQTFFRKDKFEQRIPFPRKVKSKSTFFRKDKFEQRTTFNAKSYIKSKYIFKIKNGA
jgi:hypothetical protein